MCREIDRGLDAVVTDARFVELSVWDVVQVTAKAVAYAATLGAAGGIMFLGYCYAVIAASDRREIRRLVGVLLALSLLAGGARVMATAGSMSGDIAGMFDGTFLRMILQAGEGRALAF